jgi:hypothetical protein
VLRADTDAIVFDGESNSLNIDFFDWLNRQLDGSVGANCVGCVGHEI